MRVIFIGSSSFGLKCLSEIFCLPNIDVVGVITAPEVFNISYRPEGVKNVLFADFSSFCSENFIPYHVLQKDLKNTIWIDLIKEWQPDLFVVVGWYHMIPKSWRNIAPAYGLHASLLPDYSGGAPLVWAIINGEKRTGITLFQLADGVDSGPVVGQLFTEISEDDTIKTLYGRIEGLGIELLKVHLPKMATGSCEMTIQNESFRRVFPQRCPEDGKVNWNWPAKKIYNFIRAQTHPYPGAFAFWGDRKIHFWKAKQFVSDGCYNDIPGTILGSNAGLLQVVCGDKTSIGIEILSEGVEDLSAGIWFCQNQIPATGKFS